MQIIFWGVRGSTPCAHKDFMRFGGNTTCIQVDLPEQEEVLILDCGTGIRNLGNYLIQNGRRLKGHLFVTHPHWDHIQGFPFFKPIYDEGTNLHVHMPQQPRGSCREILAGQMTETYFPVTPDMLQADINYITQPAEKVDYGEFQVEFMLANHHTNTAIYKFNINEKQIVFAPDNEIIPAEDDRDSSFNRTFLRFIEGADLVIHDGQYDREIYDRKIEWGHSSWEVAIDLIRESEVPHLIMTHHDPDSNDDRLDEVQQTVEQNYAADFDTVQLAYERLEFSI